MLNRKQTPEIPALAQGIESLQTAGPGEWHRFARGCDFADPSLGIDPLLSAFWIAQQEDCDRSTALLLLARAIDSGFLARIPQHHDAKACQAFCRWLRLRIDDGAYPEAQLPLNQQERRLIVRHLGPTGEMPLPATALPPRPGQPMRSNLTQMQALLPISTLHNRISAA